MGYRWNHPDITNLMAGLMSLLIDFGIFLAQRVVSTHPTLLKVLRLNLELNKKSSFFHSYCNNDQTIVLVRYFIMLKCMKSHKLWKYKY